MKENKSIAIGPRSSPSSVIGKEIGASNGSIFPHPPHVYGEGTTLFKFLQSSAYLTWLFYRNLCTFRDKEKHSK